MVNQADLEGRLLKANINIMTKSAFLSTILLSVKHIISTEVPTAATNGLSIWYNPNFIEQLNNAELFGLVAHECWHIAFQHMSREGNRDPEVWNSAGDYVINNLLIEQGWVIPAGGLINPAYAGMSTDEVYNILIKEPKRKIPRNLEDLIEPPEELKEEDKHKLDSILIKAHIARNSSGVEAGQLPEEITRHIEKLLDPTLPWEQLLLRFINQLTKNEYSWARKNRRHIPYLPSMSGRALDHLVFAIDTSGSVSSEELGQMLSEIQGIQNTLCPEKLTILDCDCRINHIYECDSTTKIEELTFTGGGGTSFLPVIDYCNENGATALIYFTDLHATQIKEEQVFPILWVCTSSHAPASIGDTVYIQLD